MLIIPIVTTSIITAMAGLGDRPGFARMGGKTLLFYMSTSLVAILIGLTLVNWIEPGAHADITLAEIEASVSSEGSAEHEKLTQLHDKTQGRGTSDVLNVFKELVPKNIVDAAAKNKMLGIILVSLMFGYFMSRLEGRQLEVMIDFWEGAYKIVIQITFLVLRFLPLGVGCLIATTVANTVADNLLLERLQQLGLFAITVLLALGVHMFVVLPLILKFVAGVSPLAQFRAMAPALLTAFSTASSSATLPLTMKCVEEDAGVSKRVSSFVLPLGATINMDGTALYECVAVLFLAQLAGIEIGASGQFLIVVMALLTSVGVAGIPSASLVAIIIILHAVNAQLPAGQVIPDSALAIILIFDRLLDMCRTTVNVFGDSCCATTIASSEGEENLLQD
jgi:proton glutamate symport protein